MPRAASTNSAPAIPSRMRWAVNFIPQLPSLGSREGARIPRSIVRVGRCQTGTVSRSARWTGHHLELGIYTFGEATPDPQTGRTPSPAERLHALLEEIELADQVGLDVYGVGEHHRPEYVVSAPVVVLAAAAMRTERIRLSSAVNVLSSDDPIRVFQQFATLDLLSGGRAEIMAGRGSFIESFPLFGYDLRAYDELFAEKLELLLRVRQSERLTWPGTRHTPAVEDRGVYPRPLQDPLPVWVAVGGTPESAVRTGMLGLPMALAIIGGEPARFAPFRELHRQAAQQAGHEPPPAFSINSHGLIADDSQDAADTVFPALKATMDRIGRERGWPPMSREQFDASRALSGSNFVGSPDQIVEKILYQYEIFEHDRFLLQFTVGSLPHAKVLRSIELFGTKVAPAVRAEVARRRGGDETSAG
jgi:probable LLM family oxidoreductase